MGGESYVIFQHDQPQAALDEQSQAEIFKLKMDHFEELFDWLSVKDLIALGQTCKRMQCIVDYYIRMKYAEICLEFNPLRNPRTDIRLNLNGLSSFLKRIVLIRDLSEDARIIHFLTSHIFESLTEFRFSCIAFTDEGLLLIRKFLGQLETIELASAQFENLHQESKDVYESILKFCDNLKTLYIYGKSGTCVVGVDNSWLLREYPTLEHLEITVDSGSDSSYHC